MAAAIAAVLYGGVYPVPLVVAALLFIGPDDRLSIGPLHPGIGGA